MALIDWKLTDIFKLLQRQVMDYNTAYVLRGKCIDGQIAPAAVANDVYYYIGDNTGNVFGISTPPRAFLVFGTGWSVLTLPVALKLEKDMDANSKRITGLPAAVDDTEPLRKKEAHIRSVVMLGGNNYIITNNVVAGFYLNESGTIGTEPVFSYDKTFYPVIPGIVYVAEGIQQNQPTGAAEITYYDKDKQPIRPVTTIASSQIEFTPNNGEFFVRFTIRNENLPAYKFYPKFDIYLDDLFSRISKSEIVALQATISALSTSIINDASAANNQAWSASKVKTITDDLTSSVGKRVKNHVFDLSATDDVAIGAILDVWFSGSLAHPKLKYSIARITRNNIAGPTKWYMSIQKDDLGVSSDLAYQFTSDINPEGQGIVLLILTRAGGDLEEPEFAYVVVDWTKIADGYNHNNVSVQALINSSLYCQGGFDVSFNNLTKYTKSQLPLYPAAQLNAITGIIVGSESGLLNVGIPTTASGTFGAVYDEACFNILNVKNIVKCNTKAAQTFNDYISIKVSKQNLIDAGADFNADNVFVSLKILSKSGYLYSAILVRYGDELDYTRNDGIDAVFNNGGHEGIALGDNTTFAGLTLTHETKYGLNSLKFENLRIPAIYKNMDFKGIILTYFPESSIANVFTEKVYISPALIVGSTIDAYKDYAKTITPETINEAKIQESITVTNRGEILVLGDSITEGQVGLLNHNWVGLVSNFSDWSFYTMAVGGYTCYEWLNDLQNGIKFRDIYRTLAQMNPRYCIINLGVNDAAYTANMDIDIFYTNVRELLNLLTSSGCEPIIVSNYAGDVYTYVLQKAAKEFNARFWDLGINANKFAVSRFGSYFDGPHPGTRTNSLIWHEMLQRISAIGQPKSSLKMFRLRQSVAFTDNYSGWFEDNITRAKKWEEISIAHQMLSDVNIAHFDELEQINGDVNYGKKDISDEYDLMTISGLNLGLHSLIQVVLPCRAKSITLIRAILRSSNDLTGATVLVPNYTPKSRYRSGTTLLAFEVIGDISSVVIGDTYRIAVTPGGVMVSDVAINGATRAVLGKYKQFLIFEHYFTAGNNDTAILTKVTGSGLATYATKRTTNGARQSFYDNMNKQVEFIVKTPTVLSEIAHTYYIDIDADLVKDCIRRNTLHLFVNSATDVVINDISISYDALSGYDDNEQYYGRDNKLAKGTSISMANLLSADNFALQPTPITVGNKVPNKWIKVGVVDDNYVPIDGILPTNLLIAKVIQVNNMNFIKQSIALELGEYQIQVVCRYNPPRFISAGHVYPDDSVIKPHAYNFGGISVNLSTYLDDSIVTMQSPAFWVEHKEIVPLHWCIVRIPINVLNSSLTLTIKSEDAKYIEIGRVDLIPVNY